MSQANRVQPFVKFTCARPLLIIKKLRPLNYAGEHNLPPPATSYNVNPLINNKLARHAVAGEFHEAQAWRYAGKGAGAGLAMSQLILTRCARRRVCGSGQAWHPRLRAGGAARDGAAGPCGGTSGAEGLEWQRLAAVRDSTECCALLLRTCNPSKRHRERACGLRMQSFEPGKAVLRGPTGANGIEKADSKPESKFGRAYGLRKQSFEPGKAVLRGPTGANGIENCDFEPESEFRRTCGLRKQSFEPGEAVLRGPTGANGIEKADSEPESKFGRAYGLRMQSFDPDKAIRDGLRGTNGIENGDFEPESEFRRTCGLRMQSFEPRKAVRRRLRGANGIENGDFEPESDVGKGCGIEIDIPVPESVDAETITGEQKPKPPAGLEFPRQNHYLCRAKNQDRKYGLRKTVLGRRT